MIPIIGPLLTGGEIYGDERGKSLGCSPNGVSNDHPLPCVANRIPPPNADQAQDSAAPPAPRRF